ncbi:MAG: hypothetical protein QMC93_02170 [Patescibacteria group bacterium]|nr:hypothetical protein [Patescibacteria group bacterium]
MQNSKTVKCQNCKKEFVIEPEDFAFYEKIKVPPPTWCPECRMIRRMVWRNERVLYKRKCDLCNKEIISLYNREIPNKIYCNPCWYSDKWEDPIIFGKKYNFNQPFIRQFQNLFHEVPTFARLAYNNVNSEYVNWAADSKNCYLSFSVLDCEDVLYSSWVNKSRECSDCFMAINSELLYECFNCKNCYNSAFLANCRDCLESMFLFDCVNCQNCFMSLNLRNKKFYFFNKPYSKNEYFEQLKK